MSLQELAALETAQAIENANYENVDVTYAVINEEDLLQAGSFQNLQTLVEVSSILAAQGVYTNPEQPSEKEELVRQTILTEQPVQQQEQAYQQPLEPAARESQLGTARRSRAAEVRECHVCGERAGKHSYYGGQVCPSCRAFFRRSVQSGYNATYFCIKDGNCEVTLKTRKNCQYCRYKLCEAAGMKTTWVLTEEERKQKFEGRKKKRKSGSIDEEIVDDPLARVGISSQELEEVEQYVRTSGHWDVSKVSDMNTSLIREFIRMVAFKHSLSAWGQEELRSVIRRRVERFATGVRELQELTYGDRQTILTTNLPRLLELQLCSTFNPDLQWTEQLSPLLGQEETDKLDNKLRSLNVTDLDDLHLSYLQFFPNYQHRDEARLLSLISEIGGWSQDEKEYVLVSLVLLFCPDMLDLIERRRVEDFQLKFATLLQKYLNDKHKLEPSVAVSRFAGGMLLVTRCREAGLLSEAN